MYSFTEGSGTGTVTITREGETTVPFQVRVTGGPSDQTGIIINGGGIDEVIDFPVDVNMVTIMFPITDDELGLEEIERYIAMLEIVGTPTGVIPGTTTSTEIQITDDDGECEECVKSGV